jgi:drug/metabolite transporter (DMT)-like permease
MSRTTAIALLVTTATVWGTTFPVVKGALADTGPLTFIALRFLTAAVLVLPLALRGQGRGTLRAALAGVALFSGYALQTWGLTSTTPARSAFITALSVVLVPIAEPFVGIGRRELRVWTGALIALAGLGVLLRPEVRPVTVGDLLTGGCALAFTAHVLLVQWTVRATPPARASAIQMLVAASLAVPAAGFEGWRFVPTVRLSVAVVICAVLATVFAFWAMTAVQEVLSASLTAVVLAFEPVAAAVVSILLGQDSLDLSLLVGGIVVVAGVVLATARPAARITATFPPAAD